ncbi:MAG: nicotinate-nucleotide adenylyltransferase [Longimicrobiales bacterium]
MKTGILGGTFDPPHIGHLIAGQDACTELALDRVLFVPAAQPPHKLGQPITASDVRLEMLQAALQNAPRFEISCLELEREGPSYTVDTLRTLREQDPGQELYLLLGADQVMTLPSWHEPQQIARLARVIALSRSGQQPLPGTGPVPHSQVQVTRIDVSAREIRQRVAQKKPIRFLVPAAVEAIIYERGLYRLAAPNGDAPVGVAE